MKLFNYYRSSGSYRVRIALGIKGLPYDYESVHLRRNGGEQFAPAFRSLNPQGLVPVLEDGPTVLTQSLAIIEYLDEVHPTPPLLPRDTVARALVRATALSIACEIHPLNNLRVLGYLGSVLYASEEAKTKWYQHWVRVGFEALESQLSQNRDAGPFCHGSSPTIADCCLIPQLANARRFDCDLSPYPTLVGIEAHCSGLKAFQDAAPERQPDAEG
jgi:maleylpyruvate isomerase